MFPHTEILNYIIQKKGFESYLEIGVNNPIHNFDQIKCKFKIGVDPNGRASFTGTSTEFFKQGIIPMFDIVFIDGLHHAEQVYEDFVNALECTTDEGIICIHDTDPKQEVFTQVPRNGLKGRWNGDVYKFVPELISYPVDWRTPDIDANGITVIKKQEREVVIPAIRFNYHGFINNRKEILNLCTLEEFKQWI